MKTDINTMAMSPQSEIYRIYQLLEIGKTGSVGFSVNFKGKQERQEGEHEIGQRGPPNGKWAMPAWIWSRLSDVHDNVY